MVLVCFLCSNRVKTLLYPTANIVPVRNLIDINFNDVSNTQQICHVGLIKNSLGLIFRMRQYFIRTCSTRARDGVVLGGRDHCLAVGALKAQTVSGGSFSFRNRSPHVLPVGDKAHSEHGLILNPHR